MFQYLELNVHSTQHCRHYDMALTAAPIKRMTKNLRPQIKTVDDMAEWCAIPNRELQNLIVWCCNRYADFTDYLEHDQYFSCLNNTTYIPYNAEAVPVMSFECNERVVYIVRCTGSTNLRKHKPSRYYTVLLVKKISPGSHCQPAAARFPTGLNYHSSSRITNQESRRFLPSFRCLQLGQYIRLRLW